MNPPQIIPGAIQGPAHKEILISAWHWLTKPPAAIRSPLERERARLLSAILLVFLLLVTGLIVFLTAAAPHDLPAPVLSGMALAAAYAASRTRYYCIAALMVVFVTAIEPLAKALETPPEITPLPFVTVSILLAGTLLEGWSAVIVTLTILSALFSLPVVNPANSFEDLLLIFILSVTTAAVSLAANFIRALYRRAAEQRTRQLEQNDREFRIIADNAGDIIIRHTSRGRPVYVSPSVRRLLGYDPNELLRQSLSEFVHPEDRDIARRWMSQITEQGEDSTCVLRTLHRDGRVLWFELHGSRAVRHDGQTEIISIARDISERKQVEQDLRNLEQHNRALMNAIPDLIFVLTRTGQYVDVRAPEINDLIAPQERLIGANIGDFFSPEQAREMLAVIGRALDTQSLQNLEYTIDTQQARQCFEARFIPLNQEQALAIVRNITENRDSELMRRQLTEELREQMNMLDTVLATTPDLMLIVNHQGRYLYANPTALRYLRIELSDLIDRTWYDLNLPATAVLQFVLDHEHVLSSRQPVSNNIEIKLYDEEISFSSTTSPIFDSHQQITMVLVTLHDITQQRKTEIQRMELAVQRERVEALRHLISDTSHDMKTPLTALNTSLFLLQKSISDPERRARYTSALQDQIMRLTQLLDDMSGIARLESGNATFEFEPMEVGALISRLISDHEPLALDKNQRLSFERTESSLMARVDASKFWRAASNVISNAIKYTPFGGQINVQVRKESSNAVIEVCDSGIGIAPDDLPMVFERSYRARNTEEAHASGTGLGLAITRQIVEGHGGHVEAQSNLGKGSIFRIILPLLPD